MKTKELVIMSLLAALGSILGLFEAMIPLPFLAPGLRLGFSNIIVLVSLITFGYKKGLAVSLLKSLLLMLMSGNVSSFIYSFSGALLSSIAMIIALKYGKKAFSIIGISLIGSSFHNIAQIFISSILLGNIMMFSYLPVLLIIGIFTGAFVGISSIYVLNTLKTKLILAEGDWIQ